MTDSDEKGLAVTISGLPDISGPFRGNFFTSQPGASLETTAREQPELSPKPESATGVPSAPADRAYRSRVRGQPRQGRIWVLIGVVAVALLGVGLGVGVVSCGSG